VSVARTKVFLSFHLQTLDIRFLTTKMFALLFYHSCFQADASAAAKASAAQANAPQSTAVAVPSSSSSSSAMNVAAAVPSAAQSKTSSTLKAVDHASDREQVLAIIKKCEAPRAKATKKVIKASAHAVTKPKTKPADKVKKTPSAYILFCTDKRLELKMSRPQASFVEMGKLMGHMWTSMDATAKAPYEQLALVKKNEIKQQQQQQQKQIATSVE